jgi:hypothetical protein
VGRFRDCRAEVRSSDGSPVFEDDDVDVRIEDGWILLCYWDELGAVVFEGTESSPGRFELKARSRPRTARLVHSPERGLLEGTWSEGDDEGLLLIELGQEESG